MANDENILDGMSIEQLKFVLEQSNAMARIANNYKDALEVIQSLFVKMSDDIKNYDVWQDYLKEFWHSAYRLSL